jgi:hypothetical protein
VFSHHYHHHSPLTTLAVAAPMELSVPPPDVTSRPADSPASALIMALEEPSTQSPDVGVKEICGVAAALAAIAAATAFLELHRHRRCREQRRRRAASDSLALPKRAFRGRYEYARFDFDLAIFGDGRHEAVRHHFR